MNDMINDISPVNIWKDGTTQSATKLLLRVISDDLYTAAVFYYELRTTGDDIVSNGNLTLTGSEYTTWNAGANATPEAFIWAADQLNLMLL
jgi:hypothetical protein